ncbi:MAG: hypothetical protein RJA55_2333 [Acidobacteriota bacterium]|jgi:hypothetical protein
MTRATDARALARCTLKVCNADDGRTVAGAYREARNALMREAGADPELVARTVSAAVEFGAFLTDLARDAHDKVRQEFAR